MASLFPSLLLLPVPFFFKRNQARGGGEESLKGKGFAGESELATLRFIFESKPFFPNFSTPFLFHVINLYI
jgi:hypothetical protein